jgi:2-polyprenyl-3-methyl-5-hydroxy-6-metoxy-1,4-benzoquinol methylase
MQETPFDESRAQAFGGRMAELLNAGALTLMTSVGHRTGLFDVMATRLEWTPRELAAKAGLDPRYVREWLGAMATGRIVLHLPERGTYALPQEHAASLTRAAGAHNLALQAQYLPLLASVEDQIVGCFREGGGVGYAAYRRFHEVMAEESAAVHDVALLDVTIPLVPGLRERLARGIDVLDVGCGRGHALVLLAKAYPRSRFLGVDFSESAIAHARAAAREAGVTNLRFAERDVTSLGETAAFDLVTAFDAIHDQAQPAKVLRGIAEALRPDGRFLMVDIAGASDVHGNLDHPFAPFLYTVSCMHCMTVSLAEGGEGLGAMWGEETARRMLGEAGFTGLTMTRIEADPINAYWVAHKEVVANGPGQGA